ncbi:MAG: hypothetical protein M1821_008357 [Bathelium mastoideum]|nr:MAG: hypothetical protein M1821_008357 [Bathelium mastoideum]
MLNQQLDEDTPARLPTESLGWNGLQALNSQLSGRLAGFVLNRPPSDRPCRLDNDSAFFEDDLRYILMAKPVVIKLSEERYRDMDNMALSLLDALNDIVNERLIEAAQDYSESESPEDLSPKFHDITLLASKFKHLNAMLCFLQARPEHQFGLVTGPDPLLFKFPPGGHGKIAMGYVKKWRAFLDRLSAEAAISQGLQFISLQAMGLSPEELSDSQSVLLERRASVVVGVMFKEFQQLNCAGVKTHEIKLRLSGLYTGPPQPILDVLVSCCPNGTSEEWHEARCGPFPVAIEKAGNQSLCAVIHQAINKGQDGGKGKKLHLLVNQQRLFDVTETMPKIPSSVNVTKEALVDLFRQKLFSQTTVREFLTGLAEKKVGSKEKAEIALVLARCLLDFFDDDVDLASHSWTPERIFFIRSTSTTTLTTRGDIYVSLKPRPLKHLKSVDLLQEFRAGNPILLSFARLLLEIETGEKIPIQIHPETKDNEKNWATLCRFVQQKKDKGESVQYLDAVEGSLHLCNSLPRSKNRVTGSDASKVLRRAIYEKIIRKLELVVNPHNLKRKRQFSVSEYPQAKKPSIARPPQTKLPVAAFASSERRIASSVLRKQRLIVRSKVSGAPAPDMDSSMISSHHKEQSSASVQPIQRTDGRFDGKFDGRLCDSPNTSTDVAHPRTFVDLNDTWNSRFEFKESDDIVKIAILDTGIDLCHEDFQNMRAIKFHEKRPVPARGETSQIKRIPMKYRKNFCGGDENNVQDLDGHGTQVASIVLRLAPRAELCIARICDGDVNRGLSENEKQAVDVDSYIRYPRAEIVVKAIHWAIEQKVNIINMSFGFDNVNLKVDEALRLAQTQGILIFAAMANGGIYEKAAWPGRVSNDAIGIHSCVDMGKTSSSFTAMPVERDSNFMVIGENIIAHWPKAKGGGFRPVEGTSFATPVAVSIAALILAFANQGRCRKLREESEKKVRVEELRVNSGMRRVLEAISEKSTDGYLWINPKLLWAKFPEDGEEDTAEAMREHGWKLIREALKK